MIIGSIILLIIIVIGSICIIASWFQTVCESIEDRKKERQHKKRQKKGSFHFERLNEVEGILTVDGREMRTYNVGEIRLNGKIDIVFYESVGTEIRVTDIYYEGNSLYSYTAGTWKEKADYAVAVLKSLARTGDITYSLASEVEEILLEVETLNRHIDSGHLIRVEDDFAWVF